MHTNTYTYRSSYVILKTEKSTVKKKKKKINTQKEVSPNIYITYLLYSEGKNLPKSVLKAKSKQYESLQQRGSHPKSIKSKHTQLKKVS